MRLPTVKKAKITRRRPPEPEFKKAPRITKLEYLKNYYTNPKHASPIEKTDIVLSRRVDEGISKDYVHNGIIAGNKSGRFSTKWINPKTGQEYNNHWDARRNTEKGTKIKRFSDARGQISVPSSAIHSYDYSPDVKRLILRYTSNPNKDYTFDRVTNRRYQDLNNAASKGRFVYYILRKYNRAEGY